MAALCTVAVMALPSCGERPDRFVVVPAGGSPEVSVTSTTGTPLTFADGARAKKQADAQCGTYGVRTSIYDRFDRATGEWVYPGGCA